jgi:hypothetical protein
MAMADLEDFTNALHAAIEGHSDLLKGGNLFLPEYLHHKRMVSTFGAVVDSVAHDLRVDIKPEYTNRFQKEYEINRPERVDYALFTKQRKPWLFLELESLNRSQMYLFTDGPIVSENEDNKLWYYNATLGNSYTPGEASPRYFVFLLILPDRPVNRYEVYDLREDYQIHDPSLREVIYQSPYKFFDMQIKAAARGFLLYKNEVHVDGAWKVPSRKEAQQRCELVFITCTLDRLIISRGRDLFDRSKELVLPLKWGKGI